MSTVKMVHFTDDKKAYESANPVTAAESKNPSQQSNVDGSMGVSSFGLDEVLSRDANAVYRARARHYLEDHMRSYIHIDYPLVNTAVASGTVRILNHVLGISEDDLKSIIEVTKVYDVNAQELILTVETQPGGNYLYNGEILKYFIDRLDLKRRTCEVIRDVFLIEFYTKKSRALNPISVTYVQNGGNILTNYLLEVNFPPTKKNRTLDEMWDFLQFTYFPNTPDNAIFDCMRVTTDSLRCCYIQNVRVLPIGMRPSVDNRSDGMTILYNDFIRRSQLFQHVYRENDFKGFGDVYAKVQHAYTILVSMSETDKNKLVKSGRHTKLKNKKSLVEYASSKYGHIRHRMLSKVQDFSGRSVVVADPTVSINQISVPRKMLKKVMSYHTEIAQNYQSLDECCENVPVMFNRAPTLHKLSWRGFYAKPSDSNAIGNHPLINDGYNADHDGDQMGIHVPLSKQAIEEVAQLMTIYHNLYIPSTGDITIKPKQDMLYGLNIISGGCPPQPGYVPQSYTFATEEEFVESFLNQEITIWDNVKTNISSGPVTYCLLQYCFPKEAQACINEPITKKNIESIMQELCAKIYNNPDEPDLVQYIDRITQISFAAATLYPPTLNVIIPYNENLHEPFKHFVNNTEAMQKWYALGLDSHSSYNRAYSEKFEEIASNVSKTIADNIGQDNGFVRLMTCGARGSIANLQQIFSYKGRIARSNRESFNTVITSSYLHQLSDLEQFVVAHGTRKSMQDKTRKPADTGYASRRMAHVTADAVIRHNDCQTTKGIEVSYRKFLRFAETTGEADSNLIKKMIVKQVKGRFIAADGSTILDKHPELRLSLSNPITEEQAHGIANILTEEYQQIEVMGESFEFYNSLSELYIRSPITCESKYCVKCYGINWATHRLPVRGTPVGILAATSLGEPSTQLSMRNFQKGGVASKADITDDFDKINAILMGKDVKQGKDDYWDPVAWDTGEVVTHHGNSSTSVWIIPEGKTIHDVKPVYYKGILHLRKYAVKGEGLSEVQGNLSVKEIYQKAGIQATQEYIAMSIYHIYFAQVGVIPIHSEIYAAESVRYLVVDVNDNTLTLDDGRPAVRGMMLTPQEYVDYSRRGSMTIVPIYCNSNDAPLHTENFLSAMAYMHFKGVTSKAMFYERVDTLKSAFSLMLMGQAPIMGTTLNTAYITDMMLAYTQDAAMK